MILNASPGEKYRMYLSSERLTLGGPWLTREQCTVLGRGVTSGVARGSCAPRGDRLVLPSPPPGTPPEATGGELPEVPTC